MLGFAKAGGLLGAIAALIALLIVLVKQLIGLVGFIMFVLKIGIIMVFIGLMLLIVITFLTTRRRRRREADSIEAGTQLNFRDRLPTDVRLARRAFPRGLAH